MSKVIKHLLVTIVIWCAISGHSLSLAVNPNDVIKLKKAGVSDGLLKEIIRSDAIARALITVDEIVEMKAVNIGDNVILTIIREGSAAAPELDREDAADRALKREVKRSEIGLELQRKELDLVIEYVSALITNPEVIKLVGEGKIASEDYARIVKYLKQYARGEETLEYGEDGDITIDIDKTQK